VDSFYQKLVDIQYVLYEDERSIALKQLKQLQKLKIQKSQQLIENQKVEAERKMKQGKTDQQDNAAAQQQENDLNEISHLI
jgi:hypothetical protein